MKRILLFSDGTGNSSAKLFKTNVWRLYQALDLGEPKPDDVAQIACYDDGVGTSSFKPLAVLGGTVGWGLKRNVLELYEFLCRNWEPGDGIYAFGFSRGAFTIRVLIGFVLNQGLIRCCSDQELAYATRDAYRAYRSNFNRTGGLVATLRYLRDTMVRLHRKLRGQNEYAQLPYVTWYGPWPRFAVPPRSMRRDEVPNIAFVGVWDTVAAYGGPLAELTRGIDDWVWPLSMPNYRLSPKVKVARHALALDDERDAFHPLLWDEVAEDRMAEARQVRPGRLQQVWFAGMHSDVGGGYPDDSLSDAPLRWMMREAESAGLRFRKGALEVVAPPLSLSAPMHDSRRGMGGYYRYQPRKISARIAPPDRDSLIMHDPDPTWPLLTSVKVHESVFTRIRSGPDRYAPIVLPKDYEVVDVNGVLTGKRALGDAAEARESGQIKVWNDVWRKRVNYFLTVGASLLLAFLPAMESILPTSACAGPVCLLTPLIQGIGRFLPGFTQYWLEAFARHPGALILLVGTLVLLLLRGAGLQRRIQDRMRLLWLPLHGQPGTVSKQGWFDDRVEWLRTRSWYQITLRWLKWSAAPTALGVTALFGLLVLIAGPIIIATYRVRIQYAEQSGTICELGVGAAGTGSSDRWVFDTRQLCSSGGAKGFVEKGRRYQISLTVLESWMDQTIAATPLGFGPDKMAWPLGYVTLPFRRSLVGAWFQPFVTIAPSSGSGNRRTQAVDFQFAGSAYVATFEAAESGQVHLWVNDAVIPGEGLFAPWRGLTDRYYANNRGTAEVKIELVQE